MMCYSSEPKTQMQGVLKYRNIDSTDSGSLRYLRSLFTRDDTHSSSYAKTQYLSVIFWWRCEIGDGCIP